jgi:hypothetical protein
MAGPFNLSLEGFKSTATGVPVILRKQKEANWKEKAIELGRKNKRIEWQSGTQGRNLKTQRKREC